MPGKDGLVASKSFIKVETKVFVSWQKTTSKIHDTNLDETFVFTLNVVSTSEDSCMLQYKETHIFPEQCELKPDVNKSLYTCLFMVWPHDTVLCILYPVVRPAQAVHGFWKPLL